MIEHIFKWKTKKDLDKPVRSKTVSLDKKGVLSLVDTELIADEIGRTTNPANLLMGYELVKGNRIIKKELFLDKAYSKGGTLSIYAERKDESKLTLLDVEFNGIKLNYKDKFMHPKPWDGVFPPQHPLAGQPCKEHMAGAWQVINIPIKNIKKGVNTIIIRARDDDEWYILVERSSYPNRSALSLDGGRTWDYENLGLRQHMDGEYLIRLKLNRYPSFGYIESDTIDLWQHKKNRPAIPCTIESLDINVDVSIPKGTKINILGRLGETPIYNPENWTSWVSVSKLKKGRYYDGRISSKRYRFAQWRIELLSKDHKNTPIIRSVNMVLKAEASKEFIRNNKKLKIEQPRKVVSSRLFINARKEKRIELLSKKYKLYDKIINGKDEIDSLLLMTQYISRQTNIGNHKDGEYLRDLPDYDAFLAMELADKMKVHGMCVNEAAVFVQFVTSLGWVARRATWSHAVAEVWVNSLKKWVTFDVSNSFTYIDAETGEYLNNLEIGEAWKGKGRFRKIQPITAHNDDRKINPLSEKGVMFFTRPFYHMRSNILEMTDPDEFGHGRYYFKYNGWFRYQHSKRKPFPWFDNYSTRKSDFLWSNNQVYAHVSYTSEKGKWHVELEHDMPNFERFEKKSEVSSKWEEVGNSFIWDICKEEEIELRALNHWQAELLDSRKKDAIAFVNKNLTPIITKLYVQ